MLAAVGFAFDIETVSEALGVRAQAVEVIGRAQASTAEVVQLRVRGADGQVCTVFAKYAVGEGLPAAERELRFYRTLAPRWSCPAPRLLGWARVDGEPQTVRRGGVAPEAAERPPRVVEPAGLLLITEDLTADGYRLGSELGADELAQVVEMLVAFQAAFWNDVQGALPFGRSVTQSPQAWPPEVIALHATELRVRALSFGDAGDRALLADVLPRWERQLAGRVATGHGLTLSHGDFHLLGNVLFAAGRPPRVIDWSEVKPALPTHDLAYCLHVPPSPDRLARDRALLRRYWEHLTAAGITDYPWPLCEWDYQLSLITCLFQAVLQDSVHWFRKTAALVDLHDARAVLDRPPPLP
jgi:hypothetical protein